MKYTVSWTETSFHQLKTLDKVVAERVIAKVETISEMPFRYVKPLKRFDLYILRVGEYRVIMSIERRKMIIFVLEI